MQIFDLKAFRRDKNLTQVDVAALFGCKQNFISNIEAGLKPIPTDKLDILRDKYGDISSYVVSGSDTLLKGVSPLQLMYEGADAFTNGVVKMMNDKVIAPYGMLVEKEKEIEKLNRQIGRLKAELDAYKKMR